MTFVVWEKTRAPHTKICIPIRARNRGFLPLLFYLSKSLNDTGTTQWHSSFGKILYYLKWLGCRRNPWNDHMCSFVSKRKLMCSFVSKWKKNRAHPDQICIRIRARNRGFLPLLLYLAKNLNDTGATQWHSSFGKSWHHVFSFSCVEIVQLWCLKSV